jgi:hypothetical protein
MTVFRLLKLRAEYPLRGSSSWSILNTFRGKLQTTTSDSRKWICASFVIIGTHNAVNEYKGDLSPVGVDWG